MTGVTLANIEFMWQNVILPRNGDLYVFGGTMSPNNPSNGTDCSGAVSYTDEALLFGASMSWARQFSTLTFAGAQPGQTGPFGGASCTSNWVCVASPADIPADAVMQVAVLQLEDPTQAHMVCAVLDPTNLTGFNPTLSPSVYVGIESGGSFVNAQGNSTLHVGPTATAITDPMFDQYFYLPGPVQMTLNGIDYSSGMPGGAAIAAAGYAFAVRYVTAGFTDLTPLTQAEASDLLANGVAVVSNWEIDPQAALNGFSQGVQDAQNANANHLACGGDPNAPIYFSVDFDEAQSQDPSVDQYFQGVASVIGLARTGCYGGFWIISRLFNAGLITFGWQTQAWSGDPDGLAPLGPDQAYLDPRANILQVTSQGFVNINGVQCDADTAYTANYGQWFANQPAPPTPGPPVTDPDASATLQSISDKLDGTDGTGTPLPYRNFELLDVYEGPGSLGLTANTTSSVLDQVKTHSQIFTRTVPDSQGNQLDGFDLLVQMWQNTQPSTTPTPAPTPTPNVDPVVPVVPVPVVPTPTPAPAPVTDSFMGSMSDDIKAAVTVLGGAAAVGTWVLHTFDGMLSPGETTILSSAIVLVTGLVNKLVTVEHSIGTDALHPNDVKTKVTLRWGPRHGGHGVHRRRWPWW